MSSLSQLHRRHDAWRLLARSALALALPLLASVSQAQASLEAARHSSRSAWADAAGGAASARSGVEVSIGAARYRALTLDAAAFAGLAQSAPAERSEAARRNPLVVSLPDPTGGWQRFTLADSPVMEPGLAARHPGIRTFAGHGIDDATATLRLSLTPLGLQASVRSARGGWAIDPVFHLDQSLYGSYFRRDATSRRSPLVEPFVAQAQLLLDKTRVQGGEAVQISGAGFAPQRTVMLSVRRAGDSAPLQVLSVVAGPDGALNTRFKAGIQDGSYEVIASDGRGSVSSQFRVLAVGEAPTAAVGAQLRTYRLALLTDNLYADYFGAANVTAAKVALINRVTQVYEDETSIRLVLIANNDLLNLNTVAQMQGTNGPCGGSACFTAGQAGSCGSSTLARTRQVIGLLVGASSFDVGHIALGANGGGIASLGVVGGNNKAQGCTGIDPPTGDLFAIDFVAHEIGHQFAGNHSFNGVNGNCSGANRSSNNSVEPGSGTTVMAYAGICGADNLQPNSDAYWSQRSFDEIVAYTSAAETSITEVQQAALTAFTTNGQQFQLRLAGADSAPIVRGSNFTAAGIQAAIQALPGWPAGGTVAVSALTDTGFTLTFGGSLVTSDVALLQLVACSGGCSGFVGEVAKGGPTTRGGSASATGNSPPAVTVPAGFTIPVRTPFQLSGSATDANGDPLTYLWEQTDRGGASGTALTAESKTNGPLFRVFGTRKVIDALEFDPPGQNAPDSNPTRVFPDLLQILANNTNAASGSCPGVVSPPSVTNIDCYSEHLPTAAYVGTAGVNASPARLNFKLTARDGRGGVNSATTVLTLASAAGPFLVTAPNTAVTLDGFETTTISWAVAGTNAAPVNTTAVRILLSLDGGLTWPTVLVESTPNDGSEAVPLPNVAATQARVRVEAVGNVFFDVSDSNFTIRFTGDADGNGAIDCRDVDLLRRFQGITSSDPRYVAAYDFNNNGVIDAFDLGYVTKRVPRGIVCSTRRAG